MKPRPERAPTAARRRPGGRGYREVGPPAARRGGAGVADARCALTTGLGAIIATRGAWPVARPAVRFRGRAAAVIQPALRNLLYMQ